MMNNQKNSICSLLQPGVENALPIKALLRITEYKTARALQSQIAIERENGALILSSSSGGYYLPSVDPERGKAEIEAYIHTLRGRALSTLKILRTAKRAIKLSNCQMELVGW